MRCVGVFSACLQLLVNVLLQKGVHALWGGVYREWGRCPGGVEEVSGFGGVLGVFAVYVGGACVCFVYFLCIS